MNIEKIENPSAYGQGSKKADTYPQIDAYPLIQRIDERPVATAINGSIDDESIDESVVHAADEENTSTRLDSSASVGFSANGIRTNVDPDFNPIPVLSRVRKGSNCVLIFAWTLCTIGVILVFTNLYFLAFKGDSKTNRYTDVDGQELNLKTSTNNLFILSLLKITIGALLFVQGRIIDRVFFPIYKEYKKAERGRGPGIKMDQRKSKMMVAVKRKICKITAVTALVALMTLVAFQNSQDAMVDQFIQQKYEYIQLHNTTNATYSVERMKQVIYNETHQSGSVEPKSDDERPKEDPFAWTHHPDHWRVDPHQNRDDEPRRREGPADWDQEEKPSDDKAPSDEQQTDKEDDIDLDDYEFKGKPLIPDSNLMSDLHHRGHGSHGQGGQHHGPPPHGPHGMNGTFGRHHQSRHHHDEKSGESEKKDNNTQQTQKPTPYEEWLDKLPYMDQSVARSQAKAYEHGCTYSAAFWFFVLYLIGQTCQIFCIKRCVRVQQVLETKYMGPEILVVQPSARQVAVATRAPSAPTAADHSQPVIQYIVAEPTCPTNPTGNIVTANQIV